ncbi:MAG: (Fe-S)-binding protein [Thermodesulfobacteriota bacterium]
MDYEDLIHRCFRCGFCKLTGDYGEVNCPAYRKFRFETYSPGGRLWLMHAWLKGEIRTTERFNDIIYSCATCGNCMEHCVMKFKDDLVRVMTAMKAELVSQGIIPPMVRDFLKHIHLYGNPYKQSQDDRAGWAAGHGFPRFKDQEYLFYVGCAGSYDERGKRIARSAATLFRQAGLSFGVLGSEEICDGNEVKAVGELGLFEQLARQNIRLLQGKGVGNIITLSPHGYNAMKKEYPVFEGRFNVLHYTQVLSRLLRDGRIHAGAKTVSATFHDPCYLGRHNREYRAPRDVLRAIPGLRLIEMEQSCQDALCCGGGGGNFYTDILGRGPESPGRIRIRQALQTGAEILAVACPKCARMLDDAVKIEGREDRIRVLDVSEVLLESP